MLIAPLNENSLSPLKWLLATMSQIPINMSHIRARRTGTSRTGKSALRSLVTLTVILAWFVFVPVAHAAPPVADFSGTPTSGVAPLNVSFTDSSTENPTTWSWDFNNDTIEDSTLQNPSFIYNTPGTYTVSLTATNAEGSDTVTKTDYITVTDASPVADFSGTPTSGVEPLSVDFTDATTGNVTNWSWDFNNDTIEDSTLQNPSYIYNSPGTYTVSLTATGPGGPDTVTKTDYITVSEPVPVAEFSATPTSGSKPLSVTFTDLSTPTGEITAWAWDFDNDTIVDSTAQNPVYNYTAAGTYTVKLTVTSPGGVDDEIKVDYITVSDAGWYVDAAIPSSGDGTSWATAFKTITEGIVAATAGDTINVAAGFYYERLVIDKQLTIVGAGWDSTIVQPLDVPTAGVYDVEIDASGTIIQDFGFDFNGPADDRGGTGIAVGDLDDPPVTNVQISNNKIYTGDRSGVGGTGIQTGKNCDVSGLMISGNIFYGDSDGSGEAIDINPYTGAGDVTIQNNEFYGYLYAGVSIEASNVQVTGNIINSDVTKGFYGVRFIDVTGGQSYSNVLISNNDIQNLQYAISIGTSTDVGSTLTATVYINTLTNNDAGIRVRYGADPTMIHNNIFGNANYGISNEVTEVVAAERNWWGDPSGPYDPSDDILTGGWYNPGGAGDTVSDYVDYDPWSLEIHTDSGPLADFSGDPLSGTPPLTVQFADGSVGQITDYYWEFGDGQTSAEQNPVHQYQADGDYTVKLTVTGPEGSDMRGKVDYIQVAAPPPMADFSASPTSGVAPLNVTFTDQSTGFIDSWAWDFDNDGNTDSTQQDPSFVYNTPGTYTVALTVTGPGGGVIEEKINYILVKSEPVADFSASPTSGVAPLNVTFTDQSVGTVTSWDWDFDDDGSTDSTAQNPSYAYNTPGTYTVTLTINGGSDVRQRTDYIHVSVSSPTADFSASPTSGVAPLNVTFTDQSVGTVTSWDWDFDDDGSTDSTAQNPSYAYNTPGTYTVTLTINGGSDVRQRTDYVVVSEVPPECEFDANPTSGTVPLSVQFIDLSTGPVTGRYWEFGDGDTSIAQNPVHDYQTGGYYTVRLTVSGPGGSDVKGKVDYIHVGDLPPEPDFIGNPVSGDAPVTVQFTDLSTGVITDWAWDFDGDGNTDSTEQNPFHTYQDGGVYDVELMVTGPGGSEFRGKIGYIEVGDEPPVAEFSGSPTSGMRPLRVDFTDLSTGVITDYYWEFGDGHDSTEQDPTHDYHVPGDYTVTLTVSGPGGSDIRGKVNCVHVLEAPPVADFIASPTIVAAGTDVQFTDLSIGTIADYAWDFDNNGSTDSTEQNPTHAYQSPGYYTVRLTVSAPAGSDFRERVDYIYVNAGPVAEFTASPTSGNRPLTVQFADHSTGSVTDYLWEFDDGDTSTDQNPIHIYQSEGDFTVRLTVNGSDFKERIAYIHVGEETSWAKFYGSPGNFGNDRARDIQPTSDGGYIVVGWAVLGSDMWISKLNSDGTIRWQKAFDGSRGDFGRSVEITDDGGCVVAGYTYSFGPDQFHSDIWLMKLDSEGNTEWQRVYGDIGTQRVSSIRGTADGGYIMAGESNPGNRYDFWVLKLTANGTSAWQKTYSVGGGYDRAYAVQQTLDGGYIVCGESDFNFWILKLKADGTVDWEKAYNDGGWNIARAIEQTTDFGYIVAGEGDTDAWVMKLNADGTIVWQKTYGGTGGTWDAASSVQETFDGGYVVAGYTRSFGQGDSDVWVLKLDANGTIVWEKTYGGSEDEDALQIRESANGYIVAGWTESFGAGFNNYPDIWVLNLDINGEIPGCTAMGTSTAVVTDTAVQPVDTNAFVSGTDLLPLIAGIVSLDTSVDTSAVCSDISLARADFSANPTTGVWPLDVQFTDLSSGTITGWSWSFGDGHTSTEPNPSHVYQAAGQYTVSLTIDGPDGLDTETKSHYIEALHFADFSAGPLAGIAPLRIFFTDETSGNPTAWLWDFGDGKTSTRRNPSNTYFDMGYYAVSLTATTANGEDTITKTDYVYVTDYGVPVINALNPTAVEPKRKIRIRGFNFGDTQGDSVVHIGPRTFDASKPRIKEWTNTRIVIRIPNQRCDQFPVGEDSRTRKVWVTVDGVNSNMKTLTVLKPATCP